MKELEGLARPVVKLVGEDGNAYAILGRCQAAMRKASWKRDQIGLFLKEVKSGDYDHLLATVMKYCDEDSDDDDDY